MSQTEHNRSPQRNGGYKVQSPDDMKRQLRIMQSRRDRSRTLTLSIIAGIVLVVMFFMISLILGRNKERPQLEFINAGSIEKSIHAKGILVRQEYVIDSPGSGVMEPTVQEGYKVDKNGVILRVTAAGMDAERSELNELEKQIFERRLELIEAGQADEAALLYQRTAEDLEPVVRMLRREASTNQMRDLKSGQASIGIMLTKRAASLDRIKINDEKLNELLAHRKALQDKIQETALELRAPDSGIVSYRSDGLEQELNFDFAKVMSPEQLDHYMERTEGMIPMPTDIPEGAPACRVVTDIRQYMVLKVKGLDPSFFDDSHQVVSFRINDLDLLIPRCVVDHVVKTDDGSMVVLRTDKEMDSLLARRKIDGNIMLSNVQGLKVPQRAVIRPSKDADVGRVRLLQKGYVKEYQVNILASDEDSFVISQIDEKQPVSEGDIIIVNPETVKDGDPVR